MLCFLENLGFVPPRRKPSAGCYRRSRLSPTQKNARPEKSGAGKGERGNGQISYAPNTFSKKPAAMAEPITPATFGPMACMSRKFEGLAF